MSTFAIPGQTFDFRTNRAICQAHQKSDSRDWCATHVRILCPKAYLVRISCPNPRRRLTTTAPPDSALRLDLRPGEWVLWEGRVHRLESLRGVRARIQETGSADPREVLVTELRGLPSLPIVQLDRRLEKLRIVDTPAWNKAHQREAIILDALQGDGSTTTRVDAAAKILGLSRTVVVWNRWKQWGVAVRQPCFSRRHAGNEPGDPTV
jgi:hypothetical protein